MASKARVAVAGGRIISLLRPATALYNAALRTCLGGVLIVVLSALSLRAQVGTADVLGTVSDPSGAVILNAQVTIRNVDTGETRTSATNDSGDYIFNMLPNGKYILTVAAKGFNTHTVLDISLSANDRARYNITLATGTVSENVQVSAATEPTLQTDTSAVTSVISNASVQDLPLSGRNLINAIQLQPGVTAGFSAPAAGQFALASSGNSVADRRASSTIAANGQSDALNDQLIDGFDNNERFRGLIALRPSLDGIAEMTVDTNTYRAEYGRTAGAVVNIVTKAGTNAFHGSAFEYLRNDITDASDFFAQSTPEARINEFGGSAGGPIRKNKTFFFVDVEDDRIVQGIPYVTNVPTAYERENPGDFSDVNGPNLIAMHVPLNSVALGLFNLYPMPNVSGTAATDNYKSTPNKTQFGATVDGRLDHHFSSNDLFFVRYAYNPVDTFVPEAYAKDTTTGIYPGGGLDTEPGPSNTTAQNLQLDYVHIFNPRLLLDLKAAFTRVNIVTTPLDYQQGDAAKFNIPNVATPGLPATDVLTSIMIFSWDLLGSAQDTPLADRNNTFQYSGSVNYTHGAHNFKFGAGLIRRQVNADINSAPGGSFLFVGAPPFFFDRANFLAGAATIEERVLQLQETGYRTWEPSLYLQDDWRLGSRLTVNLGVRYDIFTPFTEAHGKYTNFDPSTLSSGVGAQNFILGTKSSTIGVATDYHDVAPRVGFAYSITPKTVLRGGFGLSFFPADVGSTNFLGNQTPISLVQNQNPPTFFIYNQVMPDFSAGPAVVSEESLSTYASNPGVTSLSYKAKNLRSSYVEQMNLFLERELGANKISLGYLGVLGQALLRTDNLDLPDPPGAGNATPEYVYQSQLPNVNTITNNYNGCSSNYNALQLTFVRRLAKGLSMNANYTWAHSLSNNDANTLTSGPSIDYGNTYFDIHHRVTVTGNYALPIGTRATGIKAVFLKGWQANSVFFWQTGLPFTVGSNATAPNHLAYINQPGITTERPDMIGKGVLSHPLRNSGGSIQWLDPYAFTPQVQGTHGDERVNQLFGPHDRRDDLSLLKDLALNERWRMQFRVECFNLSNTANFGVPDNALNAWVTPTTGAPYAASIAQGNNFGAISSLAGSETPRQFQFALKLLF